MTKSKNKKMTYEAKHVIADILLVAWVRLAPQGRTRAYLLIADIVEEYYTEWGLV